MKQAVIKPRKMDFKFDESIPTYWFNDDVFKTLLLTAQSCTFPEGERFFINAVRQYQDKLQDPVLRKQVSGFIGQEAHHGNEHTALNAFMEKRGFPTEKVQGFVKQGLGLRKKYMSPQRQLAMTCALEHFTAMLAEQVLENPKFFKGMDERVLALWMWHAVEESEHKAVAYDVYQDQVSSYWVRASQMVFTTLEFSLFSTLHMRSLVKASPRKMTRKERLEGLRFLFGKGGLVRELVPRYLAYFRRDFHPDDVDSVASREQALAWLSQKLNRPLAV